MAHAEPHHDVIIDWRVPASARWAMFRAELQRAPVIAAVVLAGGGLIILNFYALFRWRWQMPEQFPWTAAVICLAAGCALALAIPLLALITPDRNRIAEAGIYASGTRHRWDRFIGFHVRNAPRVPEMRVAILANRSGGFVWLILPDDERRDVVVAALGEHLPCLESDPLATPSRPAPFALPFVSFAIGCLPGLGLTINGWAGVAGGGVALAAVFHLMHRFGSNRAAVTAAIVAGMLGFLTGMLAAVWIAI